jgi:hypothetical protein
MEHRKAITAIKQARALDKKAENARELGLDYEPVPENFIDALKFDVAMRDAAPVQEPADGTQVSKVWWDGEKLMAKPIPLVDFYQTVQDSTCNETLRAQGKAYPRTCRKCGLGPCIGAPKQPQAAQPTTEESSAVATPVREPDHGDELTIAYMSGLHDGKKRRQWIGLTDEERYELLDKAYNPESYAVLVEAKLKEKNT